MTSHLSSWYDKMLYALAVMEFAARRSIPVDGFHETERYGSFADCNGTRYLSTRILPLRVASKEALESRSMFHLAIRRAGEEQGVVHQVSKHRMAHNLALSCEDGVLYGYGGTDTRNGLGVLMGSHDGIYKARVMRDGSLQDAVRVLTGKHEGCVEKRVKFNGVCEFDGKFSVVTPSPGRVLLYARANTVAYHGGRHAQMVESNDGGETWSNFRMLHIDGVEAGEADNNVYFFNADTWNRTHLIGTYPAVLKDGRSGVFRSYSSDGVRWSSPRLVVQAKAFGQRVELFPVGVREGRVHVMHVNLLNDVFRGSHGVEMRSYDVEGGDDMGLPVDDFPTNSLRLLN